MNRKDLRARLIRVHDIALYRDEEDDEMKQFPEQSTWPRLSNEAHLAFRLGRIMEEVGAMVQDLDRDEKRREERAKARSERAQKSTKKRNRADFTRVIDPDSLPEKGER